MNNKLKDIIKNDLIKGNDSELLFKQLMEKMNIYVN